MQSKLVITGLENRELAGPADGVSLFWQLETLIAAGYDVDQALALMARRRGMADLQPIGRFGHEPQHRSRANVPAVLLSA